jgi:hypothetical protein
MDFKSVYFQLHDLSALPPGRNPGTRWVGVCVNSKAGLDVFGENKNLLPLLAFELRIFKPVATSLYRLPNSGSLLIFANLKIYPQVSTGRCPEQHVIYIPISKFCHTV